MEPRAHKKVTAAQERIEKYVRESERLKLQVDKMKARREQKLQSTLSTAPRSPKDKQLSKFKVRSRQAAEETRRRLERAYREKSDSLTAEVLRLNNDLQAERQQKIKFQTRLKGANVKLTHSREENADLRQTIAELHRQLQAWEDRAAMKTKTVAPYPPSPRKVNFEDPPQDQTAARASPRGSPRATRNFEITGALRRDLKRQRDLTAEANRELIRTQEQLVNTREHVIRLKRELVRLRNSKAALSIESEKASKEIEELATELKLSRKREEHAHIRARQLEEELKGMKHREMLTNKAARREAVKAGRLQGELKRARALLDDSRIGGREELRSLRRLNTLLEAQLKLTKMQAEANETVRDAEEAQDDQVDPKQEGDDNEPNRDVSIEEAVYNCDGDDGDDSDDGEDGKIHMESESKHPRKDDFKMGIPTERLHPILSPTQKAKPNHDVQADTLLSTIKRPLSPNPLSLDTKATPGSASTAPALASSPVHRVPHHEQNQRQSRFSPQLDRQGASPNAILKAPTRSARFTRAAHRLSVANGGRRQAEEGNEVEKVRDEKMIDYIRLLISENSQHMREAVHAASDPPGDDNQSWMQKLKHLRNILSLDKAKTQEAINEAQEIYEGEKSERFENALEQLSRQQERIVDTVELVQEAISLNTREASMTVVEEQAESKTPNLDTCSHAAQSSIGSIFSPPKSSRLTRVRVAAPTTKSNSLQRSHTHQSFGGASPTRKREGKQLFTAFKHNS